MSAITTDQRPRSHVFRFRYGLAALVLIICGWLAYLAVDEYQRHHALVQLRLVATDAEDHQLPGGRIYQPQVRRLIPKLIAQRLPEGTADSWFVKAESLTVNLYQKDATRVLTFMHHFPEVRKLNVMVPVVDSAMLRQLAAFEKLEELSIESDRVNGGWSELGKLTRLRELDLEVRADAVLHDRGLVELETLTPLRVFALRTDVLLAQQLDHITRVKQLETLQLEVPLILMGNLERLAELPNLRALSVNLPENASLQSLEKLSRLAELHVEARVTDKDVEYILPLKDLERLELWTDQRLDASLARLEELPRLQHLSIIAGSISPAGLNDLFKFHPLQSLAVEVDDLKDSESISRDFKRRPDYRISSGNELRRPKWVHDP